MAARVTAGTSADAKFGIVGESPGLGGGTKMSHAFASVDSSAEMTRARWPKSVLNDGVGVEILGMSSCLVRKSAVMLSMSLCVVMMLMTVDESIVTSEALLWA